MVLKRQLRPEVEESCELSDKRRHLASSICKRLNYGRSLQEYLSCLEPMLRKWVQEAVEHAMDPYVRSSSYNHQMEGSIPSRNLQLQFNNNLCETLFTGNRLLTEDKSPLQVVLFDSITKQVVTCGPLSSLKLSIFVLDGDFDREDWTSRELERRLVKNREGKRPLVAGETVVTLKNGVGYVGDVSFTDNSSWIRCGKFRLGAKAAGGDEISMREAVSNAFRVKDHRGESYQKHHPPMPGDEVWRLEKIAKDGSTHKKLNDSGILCVGDFLRLYATDPLGLRTMLAVSNKIWEAIISHAMTCSDDKRYMYAATRGIGLLFNSVYQLVGVTFDGQSYHPVNGLNSYHMRMVEGLKHHAYKNLREWISVSDMSIAGYPTLLESPTADSSTYPNLGLHIDFQKQGQQCEMTVNTAGLEISSPTDQTEQDKHPFELGESSHPTQGFNPTFRNSFNFCTDSPAGFCIRDDYMGPQLSTDDLPIDDSFQVQSSSWQGNGLFLDPRYHGIGIISSNSDIISPRAKTQWCKVLAVVKWRILVKRNVAARKWKHFYGYM